MTGAIKRVLFDMEGVLSDYDRAVRVDRMAALSGQPADAVREAIWGSGLEARADAGEIGDEAYLEALGRALHHALTRDDWLDARRASIAPKSDVIALAAKLARRHPIAILTNNSHLVTDHIDYLNPEVGRVFGAHIYSTAAFGATKPAAQAYLRCLDAWRARPAETLFIDDSQANVTGALEAGLHAYRFVGVQALAAELEARGLL
ncbi:HAD family hydrolase [Pararobbsia silviterrae]|uniref:HAD family phosphatase n=1 Tax=Pararobbsia silviterrae TaxID=1792498 RepID=A0A494XNE6_9BURK|nr:HAD family phosphatase [Pararobbsia silviterrae]RKP49604.1 HAD family phosphatase [Pararobbsia silviterrae]